MDTPVPEDWVARLIASMSGAEPTKPAEEKGREQNQTEDGEVKGIVEL